MPSQLRDYATVTVCENLNLKECGSEESVVQRDEMECFFGNVVV